MNNIFSVALTLPMLLSDMIFMTFPLEQILELREASQAEVIEYLSSSPVQIKVDSIFQCRTRYTSIENSDISPGDFYFRDGEFILFNLFTYSEYTTEDDNPLSHLNIQDLHQRFGPEVIRLRLRSSGFWPVHLVYPSAGVALRTTGNRTIMGISIFPPEALDEYLLIYDEPLPHGYYRPNPLPNTFSLDWLDRTLKMRYVSFSNLVEYLSPSPEQIQTQPVGKCSYYYTIIQNPDRHPGRFYFRKNNFTLFRVSLKDTPELSLLNPKDLRQRFGFYEFRFRARGSADFVHFVYPDAGVAFTTDGTTVYTIDLFPAISSQRFNLYDFTTFLEYVTMYDEPLPSIERSF
ncbi:hypothetical protein [Baaleninema simplex]|uniref:hypothetical protein n=1 Tax=Baaleninema simplex TaxID=2862350 RepID=UPI00118182D1|nr:hypothetical protein [Baaleninema simplex]